ncbi:16S rRNA (guanine(527)-N(7))-methyltransferase RsmG, partial [bacterium]|nr:16S rRNA (guanine(527)-N(7))-methyltransferase RsmG [candidate division CSSED10-310 bacterium]
YRPEKTMTTAWNRKLREPGSGMETLDSSVRGRLAEYLELLETWNRAYNLTGIPREKWMERIVLESAAAAHSVPRKIPDGPWIDMGTGAGIPGIIVAVLEPEHEIHLVDSRAKRTDFLVHVKSRLNLQNTRIIRDRIENVADRIKTDLQPYVVAFARALAPMPSVLALACGVLASGGFLIVPGGGVDGKKIVLSEHQGCRWEILKVRDNLSGLKRTDSWVVMMKKGAMQ